MTDETNDPTDPDGRIAALAKRVDELETGRSTAARENARLKQRVTAVESELAEVKSTVAIMKIFDDETPTVRARKVAIVKHLLEKAREKSTGKTSVSTSTVAVLTDLSDRQARTYMDDIATQVEACSLKKRSDKEGKTLRFDLTAFNRSEQSKLTVESL